MASGQRICRLIGEWLRVGFCQGNFNADNCLVGGRTMDYGPFGFMDHYDPAFAKWVGSGEHFAFAAQPTAGLRNFSVLANSCTPLLGGTDHENHAEFVKIYKEMEEYMEMAVADVWRRKMGLADTPEARAQAAELWSEIEPMMWRCSVDFTIMWRQLADVLEVAKEIPADELSATSGRELDNDAAMKLIQPLLGAFYDNPYMASVKEWTRWLRKWITCLDDTKLVRERLLRENPKYVLREWMLVEAYTAADQGDMSVVQDLFQCCCLDPYGEGTPGQIERWYKRSPEHALKQGGTAYMT